MDCHEDMDEEVEESQRVAVRYFTPEQEPRWSSHLEEYGEEVIFTHGQHAEKVTCTDCHGNMDGPERRVGKLYGKDGCLACHERMQAPNECATCHTRLRVDVEPASHDAGWLVSHAAVVRSGVARRTQDRCDLCHDDPSYCDRCHQTQLPPSHYGGWTQTHGRIVRLAQNGVGEARCGFCHTDGDFCNRCHEQEAPADHRHLWDLRHGQVIRDGDRSTLNRCLFCHRQPLFCDSCHQEQQPRSHTTLFRTRTHGLEAAIDRTRCMVCHTTDYCVRCHEETPPRSHRGAWARGRNRHCAECHYPLSRDQSCRVCHLRNPTHSTAQPLPASHMPGTNCRHCHVLGFGGPNARLRHFDNGQNCEFCHR
jgi:hypothetical protein